MGVRQRSKGVGVVLGVWAFVVVTFAVVAVRSSCPPVGSPLLNGNAEGSGAASLTLLYSFEQESLAPSVTSLDSKELSSLVSSCTLSFDDTLSHRYIPSPWRHKSAKRVHFGTTAVNDPLAPGAGVEGSSSSVQSFLHLPPNAYLTFRDLDTGLFGLNSTWSVRMVFRFVGDYVRSKPVSSSLESIVEEFIEAGSKERPLYVKLLDFNGLTEDTGVYLFAGVGVELFPGDESCLIEGGHVRLDDGRWHEVRVDRFSDGYMRFFVDGSWQSEHEASSFTGEETSPSEGNAPEIVFFTDEGLFQHESASIDLALLEIKGNKN